MYVTVDMKDLCLFPNIIFSPKFKPLKCKKYDEKISSILHLNIYTHSMATHISNVKLIMHYFWNSLTGSFLLVFVVR